MSLKTGPRRGQSCGAKTVPPHINFVGNTKTVFQYC